MKGTVIMKIVSILISLLAWRVTGYDFFIILTVTSMTIDLYKGFKKVQKRLNKILKMMRKIKQ
ncbi:hypothetical protein DW856_10750 [Roseburia intestinalis]|jgi:hypothetical protein|uniref:Uncharacterized protein n=1 Tax=Roseburia intestinalis TaxID=166486 RepID=A0A3R6B6F2_9FIRM|nr:hypothetical protein DW856_10750 [Roseburia intestinalis]